MPPEFQGRVQEEVELTKRRSGWPVERTLRALGVSRTTYYRWQRAATLRVEKGPSRPPPQPVQPYEATAEEKATVIDPDGATLERIVEASQNCPVDAIIITDADGAQLYP